MSKQHNEYFEINFQYDVDKTEDITVITLKDCPMTNLNLFENTKNAAQPIKLKNVATATSGIKVFESRIKCCEHVFTKVSFF